MAGTVIVPWYATGFRDNRFEEPLNEIAAVALRYGASSWAVYRARDDRYKFQQLASFADHLDWQRYWDGPEMVEFRRRNAGHYQVLVTYVWHDELVSGALGPEVPLAEAQPEPEPEPTAAA